MLMKRIRKLNDIDPRSWEHPADTAALSALKELKGIDDIVRVIFSMTSERSIRLMVLASSVKVTPNQYPKLNAMLDSVVDTFDWPYRPDLFVTQSPFLNAGVLGVDKPFIIVNSSAVKSFEDSELMALIAHEMGHIMSGHSLYKTLIWMLTNMTLSVIPVGQLVIMAVLAALSEWNRKSELSADRAELLALQEETPSYNLLMRMAGAEDLSQVNLNEFFLQAQEYENQKSLLDGIHKFFNQLYLSHPYPVVRLQELKAWASSGFYQSILDGNYPRRQFVKTDAGEDIKAGFDFYRNSVKLGDDELSRYVGDLGAGIEKAAGELGERIKGLFQKKEEPGE